MKTLHIIDHFGLGGAQRIVAGMLDALPDAMLLPLRQKGSPADQIAVPAHQVLLPPVRNRFWQLLRLLKIPRIISQQSFAIVHCHLLAGWLFGLWLHVALPARRKPRLIFHEHDSINLGRWYYPWLAGAAQRAGVLVAVSRFIQQQMAARDIPLEAIRLLHNFVDLEHFTPGAAPDPACFGLAPQRAQASRLVGFAGRLVAQKGWQYFLEVADRLRAHNIRFLIAGDGRDAGKLARQVEALKLADRVFWLGYVGDMRDFYRLIDLLVITSERESFGLVQLEAQACGVPVILFENQAAWELHGAQSTVIISYGDTAALAGQIIHLLEDQQAYHRLVEKGLHNAREYSRSAFLSRLADIYRDAVNEQRNR
ncbi:MAG: glycosyltransferase family 4 protein [Anaerolineaceae bacterium]|jgi:glycosyltransferase involved in cell wall biosynthesis